MFKTRCCSEKNAKEIIMQNIEQRKSRKKILLTRIEEAENRYT